MGIDAQSAPGAGPAQVMQTPSTLRKRPTWPSAPAASTADKSSPEPDAPAGVRRWSLGGSGYARWRPAVAAVPCLRCWRRQSHRCRQWRCSCPRVRNAPRPRLMRDSRQTGPQVRSAPRPRRPPPHRHTGGRAAAEAPPAWVRCRGAPPRRPGKTAPAYPRSQSSLRSRCSGWPGLLSLRDKSCWSRPALPRLRSAAFRARDEQCARCRR
mmetsp:Transcript_34043/g.105989  ORF Transcript_34043/g.105989 Transcript_34043/m.105989 type:complete len:210 (-) Transcript_34043:88-717(-)